MRKLYVSVLAIIFSLSSQSQTTIFPYGSSWKYLDNGSNQGTGWRASAFNDGTWATGNGQLGYGDNDEATTLSFGPDANNKYITSYFRKSVSISNPNEYSTYTFNLRRDDGISVYINGTEVYRNNLAVSASYNTLATLASDDGNEILSFTLNSAAFLAGNNVIAVELHQSSVTSTDISFDMELLGTVAPVSSVITAYGASWKYLDNGSNQGTGWRNSSFNDAAWPAGNAELGYGDGDESTVVSFGPNSKKKYLTTYFRRTVSIPDISAYAGYTLKIKRDDGAIVYVNGTEVFRTNMPTGTVSYTTKASSDAADDGETAQIIELPGNSFIQGNNIIAVEIHQFSANNADISFDLQLEGNGSVPAPTASLTRGPYLNTATQTGIVLRWRTNVATDSRVRYGTSASNLDQVADDASSATEHIVSLSGLQPNTQYYYSVGSSSQVLQGDANNYFKTLPLVGATQKIRVLAMGDMGNNSTNQVNVRNAWLSFNGTNYTDAWLLMGDNAYANGTDVEYQSNFFNIYQGSLTKNHVLWPSPGNHDYANSSARQSDHNIPYYNIFSLPASAEAGGLASNTEAFYSFNIGNVHFVSLDSYGWESGNTRVYDTLGPQAMWLKQDLAANNLPWTVIYFHHPPYTKGSHNSDTETELINMRQRLVPIFERYKVDLVLSGHSHAYERSFLLNGHYGIETSFNAASHALSSSTARYDAGINSCLYVKNDHTATNGIVYAVVGSAGQVGGSTSGYPHNAMSYSNIANGGTLYFEVEANRLDAKWLGGDGITRDQFTIMKNVNNITNLTISSGTTVTLTASWPGTYNWSNGQTTRSIDVSPASNTSYTVTDAQGCISDVFNVTVEAALAGKTLNDANADPEEKVVVVPSILKRGQQIRISSKSGSVREVIVTDLNGRVFSRKQFRNSTSLETVSLYPGNYFVKLLGKDVQATFKVLITP